MDPDGFHRHPDSTLATIRPPSPRATQAETRSLIVLRGVDPGPPRSSCHQEAIDMRKIKIIEHISLDGVIQVSGEPSGAFC
jgi:hypothetical protein